jgi:hypothetical protein
MGVCSSVIIQGETMNMFTVCFGEDKYVFHVKCE